MILVLILDDIGYSDSHASSVPVFLAVAVPWYYCPQVLCGVCGWARPHGRQDRADWSDGLQRDPPQRGARAAHPHRVPRTAGRRQVVTCRPSVTTSSAALNSRRRIWHALYCRIYSD